MDDFELYAAFAFLSAVFVGFSILLPSVVFLLCCSPENDIYLPIHVSGSSISSPTGGEPDAAAAAAASASPPPTGPTSSPNVPSPPAPTASIQSRCIVIYYHSPSSYPPPLCCCFQSSSSSSALRRRRERRERGQHRRSFSTPVPSVSVTNDYRPLPSLPSSPSTSSSTSATAGTTSRDTVSQRRPQSLCSPLGQVDIPSSTVVPSTPSDCTRCPLLGNLSPSLGVRSHIPGRTGRVSDSVPAAVPTPPSLELWSNFCPAPVGQCRERTSPLVPCSVPAPLGTVPDPPTWLGPPPGRQFVRTADVLTPLCVLCCFEVR